MYLAGKELNVKLMIDTVYHQFQSESVHWTLSDWTSYFHNLIMIAIIVILILTIKIVATIIIWRMMISINYNWAERWLSEQSVARNHKSIRSNGIGKPIIKSAPTL